MERRKNGWLLFALAGFISGILLWLIETQRNSYRGVYTLMGGRN